MIFVSRRTARNYSWRYWIHGSLICSKGEYCLHSYWLGDSVKLIYYISSHTSCSLIVLIMLLMFCQQPSCLILAISPANQDIATSDAIKLAKEVDPTGLFVLWVLCISLKIWYSFLNYLIVLGDRTFGVLTKLDLMDKGTNALDVSVFPQALTILLLLFSCVLHSNYDWHNSEYFHKVIEGRSYRMQYPWVGIVNRSQADINKNVDMMVARRKEREYFETSPDYGHLANKMGSEYLAKMISKVLTQSNPSTYE